jgi:hypothetical protein
MSIKLKNGKYRCMFCLEEFNRSMDADSHQASFHDFVLVPMLKSEISDLLQYLIRSNGDKELIPPELFKRLRNMQKLSKNRYE